MCRLHTFDGAAQDARGGDRCEQAGGDADDNHEKTLAQDEAHNVGRGRAECDANPEFGDALAGQVGKHTVQTHAGEQQSDRGKDGEKQGEESLARERGGREVFESLHTVKSLVAGRAAQGFSQRLDDRGGIGVRSDGNRHHRRKKAHVGDGNLCEGVVHLIVDTRVVVARESPVADVTYDADDFDRSVSQCGNPNRFADSVYGAIGVASEIFVDDDDGLGTQVDRDR